MENFIRTAFWIVALAACLQGNPINNWEIKDWNSKDLKNVECYDSTMYSPTNVKSECFITALECIMEELQGRALKECESTKKSKGKIWQGLDALHRITSSMKGTSNQAVNNSSDCDCHKWPQHPFDKFVDNVGSLLQNIKANF